jgi:hypothetical protein
VNKKIVFGFVARKVGSYITLKPAAVLTYIAFGFVQQWTPSAGQAHRLWFQR